jgi:hypothetical protein
MREQKMIDELLGKDVTITTTYIGALHSVKGTVVKIQTPWMKLMHKDKPIYININQIIQISLQ